MNSSELRDAGMAIVRTLPFFDALKDESIERLLESAVRKESAQGIPCGRNRHF
jgi:hypothetical protein